MKNTGKPIRFVSFDTLFLGVLWLKKGDIVGFIGHLWINMYTWRSSFIQVTKALRKSGNSGFSQIHKNTKFLDNSEEVLNTASCFFLFEMRNGTKLCERVLQRKREESVLRLQKTTVFQALRLNFAGGLKGAAGFLPFSAARPA